MKTHTTNFKNAIKTLGREIDAKITYGEETLENEEVNYLKIITNAELFKTVMKAVEFDSNIKIDSKQWVNVKFGVKVGISYEYLDYGNYYVNDEPEYNADTLSYSYKAYDKMIESMVYYDNDPLELIYPITFKNYINVIATKLGWTFTQIGFPNENTEIESDLYIGLGYTYRDILDDICPATMGNFVVEGNELKIKYATETNDTIDKEFIRDEKVAFGTKVGGINSLVLSRAEGGDNIFRQDGDSIITNGLHEIKIKDNILLSTPNREFFIEEMFNKIKGFEYAVVDFVSTGIGYYDILDRFTIQIGEDSYSTILLNSELLIEDGLKENIYTPKLEESSTDYGTSAKTDKGIKNAVIIAYKNEAKIKSMAYELGENASKIATLEITSNEVRQAVTDVETDINNNYLSTEQINAITNGLNEDLEGISGRQSSLEQTASQLGLDIKSINTNGVSKLVNTSFVFDENGLRMSKTGEPMTINLGYFTINEETRAGLQIKRDNVELLGVDNTGGRMENLSVRKYFVVADTGRMEKYYDGIGAFYIGGVD